MDRTAFSLALGILVFVLSYSSFGIGWMASLPIALGAAIALRIAHQIHSVESQQRNTTSSATRLKQCGRKAHLRTRSLNTSRT